MKTGNKKHIILPVAVIAAVVIVLLLIPRTTRHYQKNEGYVFGTYYRITYRHDKDLEACIIERLHDVDTALSMFNPQSILSRINRNEDVVCNEDVARVLEVAFDVYALSMGAFDITVAPLVNAWGFGFTDLSHGPSQAEIDSILTFVGMQKIRYEQWRVTKEDPRMMLDASAIAKGYACDAVAQVLRDAGCTDFLVDIGGEVVAQGMNERRTKWRIGITRPVEDSTATSQELHDVIATDHLCMATSGNYRRFYYDNGEKRSHTIDPHTGYPVQHKLLSATVVASSCMEADALATACMVLGEEQGMEMIEKGATNTACYMIVAQGDSMVTVTSSRWHEMIQ